MFSKSSLSSSIGVSKIIGIFFLFANFTTAAMPSSPIDDDRDDFENIRKAKEFA